MERRSRDRLNAGALSLGGPVVLCCHRASLSGMGISRPVIQQPSSRTSFLRRTGWREFKVVLTRLRLQCPTALPVVVRTSWMSDTILGQCVRRRHRFVVSLNDGMDQPQAIETLLHEWAHALAWSYSLDKLARDPDIAREAFEAASHDETWGCAYSRVWRAYSVGVVAG